MYQEIGRRLPNNWDNNGNPQVLVSRNSQEFHNLEKEFKNRNIERVIRYENVDRYGQFLIRQQHLIALNPTKTFYTIRRFIKVRSSEVDKAIKYQLDHRRCNVQAHFSTEVQCSAGDVIFVVSLITNEPLACNLQPTRDSDFYIEYIVYIE